MSNILSISFGSFKLDVPLDGIEQLGKRINAKADIVPQKEAMSMPAPQAEPQVIEQRRPKFRRNSLQQLLANEILGMSPRSVKFIAHNDPKSAVKIAQNAATRMRKQEIPCKVRVSAVEVKGMPGIQIVRVS